MCAALAAGERFGVAGGATDVELALVHLHPSEPEATAALLSVADADVVSISQRVDFENGALDVLRGLVDGGRGGRGVVPLLSAGNDGLPVPGGGDTAKPFLLVGASTIPADGAGEKLAPYSNLGPSIDVCAPSGWGTRVDHSRGVLIAAPAGHGYLGEVMAHACALAPPTTYQELVVDSTRDFHVGARVLIRTREETSHSAMVIGVGEGCLILAELDLERIPLPISVESCSLPVARLADAVPPGGLELPLDRDITAEVGTWILLVGHDGSRSCRSLAGATARRAVLDRPLDQGLERNAIVAVDRGGFRVGEGTSTSTALVAGVVSLMLSVNPDLHWLDVRRLLRETAQWIPGPNAASGAGLTYPRVDALAAVRAAAALLPA